MAINYISVRANWVRAFVAAIVIAPAVAVAAHPRADVDVLAQPCTQVSTNGSVSLQCGTPSGGYGGPGDFSGGCMNAYGTYQNCVAQLGPPGTRR